MTPRTNKIWFDTEFIDTGQEIYLLSIGMVRNDDLTYYAELEGAPRHLASEWFQQNVIPHLNGITKSRNLIAHEIEAFCGVRPEFWAYFASYDWVLLCQLYGRMFDIPSGWPKWVMDVQQERIRKGIAALPSKNGIRHHALDDALWVRKAWTYLQ